VTRDGFCRQTGLELSSGCNVDYSDNISFKTYKKFIGVIANGLVEAVYGGKVRRGSTRDDSTGDFGYLNVCWGFDPLAMVDGDRLFAIGSSNF
jgi:hypothetical protein